MPLPFWPPHRDEERARADADLIRRLRQYIAELHAKLEQKEAQLALIRAAFAPDHD